MYYTCFRFNIINIVCNHAYSYIMINKMLIDGISNLYITYIYDRFNSKIDIISRNIFIRMWFILLNT